MKQSQQLADALRRFARDPKSVLMVVAGVCLTAMYWPTLVQMMGGWSRDPIHTSIGPSHGGLVPIFALVLLWHRWDRVREAKLEATGWGIAFLLGGVALHFTASGMNVLPVDAFSLLPVLVGMTLLIGGWPLLRVVWPCIALLAFSLPWPFRVEMAVAGPLRHFAASVSTYLLQTIGYSALLEGTTIHIETTQLQVIDECSGLGMLITFVALTTTIAFMRTAPWPDRIAMIVSAVPIAIIANIVRVTGSCMAFVGVTEGAWQFIHDLLGWVMMPLALGMLWAAVRFWDRMWTPMELSENMPLALTDGRSNMKHNS